MYCSTKPASEDGWVSGLPDDVPGNAHAFPAVSFLYRFSLLATSNFEGSLARKLHFHDFTSLFLEEVSRKSFVSHS